MHGHDRATSGGNPPRDHATQRGCGRGSGDRYIRGRRATMCWSDDEPISPGGFHLAKAGYQVRPRRADWRRSARRRQALTWSCWIYVARPVRVRGPEGRYGARTQDRRHSAHRPAEEADRIKVSLGADDYQKPFAPQELVVGRGGAAPPGRPGRGLGRGWSQTVTIDRAAHHVLVNGKPIELTATSTSCRDTGRAARARADARPAPRGRLGGTPTSRPGRWIDMQRLRTAEPRRACRDGPRPIPVPAPEGAKARR
jgi:hypothetical protein